MTSDIRHAVRHTLGQLHQNPSEPCVTIWAPGNEFCVAARRRGTELPWVVVFWPPPMENVMWLDDKDVALIAACVEASER